jgi:segregation and condensation protein B
MSPEERTDTDWGLVSVLEALIFAADEPVPVERLSETISDVRGQSLDTEGVEALVESLNQRLRETGSLIRVFRWAGGYRMATSPEAAPYLKTFFQKQKHRKLSRSLLETLAILAYRQPVTKPELDFVRGVDCDYALRKLMELNLVDVLGRADSIGRPLLYGTTRAFLETFGLEDLSDLPNLREVEELLSDPAFNRERARILMQQSLTASDSSTETESGDSEGAVGPTNGHGNSTSV